MDIGENRACAIGRINFGFGFLLQRGVFDISHDAHDLDSASVAEEGDAFPERVFIGEIIACQRFIDDQYRRRIGAIAFRDQTAFDQRDAKRFEEVRAD